MGSLIIYWHQMHHHHANRGNIHTRDVDNNSALIDDIKKFREDYEH